VINVDLPWNPAILEQRIARAHRMGQRRPVHAYLLVTEGTIEEGMLTTLSAKKDLALAALDPESTVKEVAIIGNIDELRRKLEVLVGVKPPVPVDESEKLRIEAQRTQRREKIAFAGGELLSAAFGLVRQAMKAGDDGGAGSDWAAASGAPNAAHEAMKGILAECMERAEDGGWKMTVRFRDDSAIETLAGVLSEIAGGRPLDAQPRGAAPRRRGRRAGVKAR